MASKSSLGPFVRSILPAEKTVDRDGNEIKIQGGSGGDWGSRRPRALRHNIILRRGRATGGVVILVVDWR